MVALMVAAVGMVWGGGAQIVTQGIIQDLSVVYQFLRELFIYPAPATAITSQCHLTAIA